MSGANKIKTEFEPVLKFFGVNPTGNLFKDISLLTSAIETTNIDEKLTKYFFEFYDQVKHNY